MRTQLMSLNENTEVSVKEDNQFVLHFPNLEPETKYSINLIFDTPGVSAQILGLYRLRKDENLNLTTITTHVAPNTTCFTNVKGVLEGGSVSKYVGKIIIQKDAQQTSSFLDQKVLVVGNAGSENPVKNVSEPILQIEANDVKASHGATTGRIDATQIYYLTSRGLKKSEAENLIVEGFFKQLLDKISDEKIVAQLTGELE